MPSDKEKALAKAREVLSHHGVQTFNAALEVDVAVALLNAQADALERFRTRDFRDDNLSWWEHAEREVDALRADAAELREEAGTMRPSYTLIWFHLALAFHPHAQAGKYVMLGLAAVCAVVDYWITNDTWEARDV